MNELVKVANKLEQRDYTNEGHIARLTYAGQLGNIIGQHDSHGLCYDVLFSMGGSNGRATYDSDEITFM
jgi:hypothetical protein